MSAASERTFTCAGCGTSWTVPVSTCPTCGRHSEDAYLRSTEANAKRLDEAMAEVYPASEREALLKAFGVSNGTQAWVEFQGGPNELLATLHALGFTRQSRAEIQAEAEFRFADAEWAEYQRMPDQGHSHRHHLEGVVNRWLAAHDAAVKAEALREAADECDWMQQSHDIAECAGPVPGESGRRAAIDRWLAVCDEPQSWLRARADRIEADS